MLLALGTMALAGLAYSSGSTLLGGWLSNRRQVKNQQDNQRFQGELAVKQQEFQKAQTEKNFVQSAELQREITELKAALDRQMQEERFNQNIDMWERSHFIDQVWPLINTPQGYVDYLKQIGCPMSVIVTGKLEDKLSNVLASASGFINTHYANQKQIYYYNQGWKENMRTRQGNAQRDAIHQGLSGLPTLVVMPDIENGDLNWMSRSGDLANPYLRPFLSSSGITSKWKWRSFAISRRNGTTDRFRQRQIRRSCPLRPISK